MSNELFGALFGMNSNKGRVSGTSKRNSWNDDDCYCDVDDMLWDRDDCDECDECEEHWDVDELDRDDYDFDDCDDWD